MGNGIELNSEVLRIKTATASMTVAMIEIPKAPNQPVLRTDLYTPKKAMNAIATGKKKKTIPSSTSSAEVNTITRMKTMGPNRVANIARPKVAFDPFTIFAAT